MGKRFWLGMGLLALLMALGIGSGLFSKTVQSPVAQDLHQAGESALREDWEQVRILSNQARERWERWRPLTAVFADHTPLEEIDSSFTALEVYLQWENALSFQAASQELGCMIDAVWEAQSLHWWSFL